MITTLKDRLSDELERKGWNVTQFHQAMRGRVSKGANYSSVHAYVKDGVVPSLEFLHEAANVFDVRSAYLAFGEEPRTDAELEGKKKVARMADSTAWRDAFVLKREVLRGIGIRLPKATRPNAPDKEEQTDDDMLEVIEYFALVQNVRYIPHWVPPIAEVQRRTGLKGEKIGRILRAPLEEAGVRTSEAVDSVFHVAQWLDDYITGMIPVLLALPAVATKENPTNG